MKTVSLYSIEFGPPTDENLFFSSPNEKVFIIADSYESAINKAKFWKNESLSKNKTVFSLDGSLISQENVQLRSVKLVSNEVYV